MSVRNLIRHARPAIAAACLLVSLGAAAAQIQFGMGIALPGVRIGINIPAYPQLIPVPGYPVYYAPYLDTNLFFYDGMYWVYTGDQWYSSSWYDGPWYLVEPAMVPDFILRVPIEYYRRPPPYFLRWNRREAPRWGQHWGSGWERRRPNWDRWDHHVIPPRAPLPQYQRAYPRGRYPDAARQRALENRYYRFQPQDRRDRQRQGTPWRAGPRPNQPPIGQPPQNRAQPGNRFAPQRERPGQPPLRERAGPRPSQPPMGQPPQNRAQPGNRFAPQGAPQRTRQGQPQQRERQGQPPPRRGNSREDRRKRGEPPL